MSAAIATRAVSPPLEDVESELEDVLAAFAPPSAELLGQRELMRRTDSKFVVKAEVVPGLVAGLGSEYAAFKVTTGTVATYKSLYLDTPELVCFHDHRRGKRLRHKIRIRHYPDRSISFLEIKSKRNDLVSDKHRISIAYGTEALGPDELAFLRSRLGDLAGELRPQMRIDYRRIGLLGLASDERVTIDLALVFESVTGARHQMTEAAIIEVKQSATSRSSPILKRLAAAGSREQSLSKYTTAIAKTHPEVRKNRFLVDLKSVERILR